MLMDNELDPQAVALAVAVREIEEQASQVGWDHAPTVYALVKSADLLEREELPENLRNVLAAQAQVNPDHLTAVIQEDLSAADVLETLSQLAWPKAVAGMALSMERVSVPPQAEAEAPEDPEEAARFLANHPDHDDIRIVAGVLRGGQSWAAIRARRLDSADSVVDGSQLVPDLTNAMLTTFE